VTTFSISKDDMFGVDLYAWWLVLDDQINNKNRPAFLQIIEVNDNSKFGYFQIDGITDQGTYFDLTVTYLAGNTSLLDKTLFTITWNTDGSNGNDGIDGTSGTSGSSGTSGTPNPLSVSVSVANGTSITGPGTTTPKISTQITIPANTFATNAIIEVLWISVRISGSGGTIQSAVYLSTSSGTLGSNPTAGSTLIATGANVSSTNAIVKCARDLNKVGTSGTISNAGTQFGSDYGVQTSITSFTINNSSTLYFQFCTSSTGAADVSNIRGIRITQYS